MRGVSVALVLGFHLQVPWLTGGYLGVSVFFTLSGFLVTTLLLEERHRSGRVALGRFYERRARRLMPASLTALAAVCLLVALGTIEPRTTFRGDVLASVWQSLNWRELLAERSYADLFGTPSPVAHFWSLGIEEQFYLVWPPAVVGLVAWSVRRNRPRGTVWALGLLWLLAALAAPLTAAWWSEGAAYYATWSRAAELLSGAVLAAAVVGRPVPGWCRWLAPGALVTVVVAAALTPSGRGWAFAGGLPLFALVSAALILGLLAPSRTNRLLSLGPIVWLGRVSYGVYVYHWPVVVVLDESRTGWDGWRLGALRVVVTLAVSTLSYYGIERPVRERRFLVRRGVLVSVMGASFLTVNVLAVSVAVPGTGGRAPTVISAPTTSPTTSPATGPATTPPLTTAAAPTTVPGGSTHPTTAPAPTVIAVFGDSLPAWLLRDAAGSFTRTDAVIVNGAIEGCDGLVDRPPSRDGAGHELHEPDDCRPWTTWYPTVLDTFGPPVDVALLVLGVTPLFDHQVDGTWISPCDSVGWYVADLRQRIVALQDRGLPVVFALPSPAGTKAVFTFAADHRTRMTCVRAALSSILADLAVPVIDLADVLCPEGDCDAIRQRDGLHVDPGAAPNVLDWVVDRVLERIVT